MLSHLVGAGLASVLDVQSLFLYQKNRNCAVTRHHADPNINLLS